MAISLTTIAYYADKRKWTSQSESGQDEDPNLILVWSNNFISLC